MQRWQWWPPRNDITVTLHKVNNVSIYLLINRNFHQSRNFQNCHLSLSPCIVVIQASQFGDLNIHHLQWTMKNLVMHFSPACSYFCSPFILLTAGSSNYVPRSCSETKLHTHTWRQVKLWITNNGLLSFWSHLFAYSTKKKIYMAPACANKLPTPSPCNCYCYPSRWETPNNLSLMELSAHLCNVFSWTQDIHMPYFCEMCITEKCCKTGVNNTMYQQCHVNEQYTQLWKNSACPVQCCTKRRYKHLCSSLMKYYS